MRLLSSSYTRLPSSRPITDTLAQLHTGWFCIPLPHFLILNELIQAGLEMISFTQAFCLLQVWIQIIYYISNVVNSFLHSPFCCHHFLLYAGNTNQNSLLKFIYLCTKAINKKKEKQNKTKKKQKKQNKTKQKKNP